MLRGFRVLPMAQAAPAGEVFITATGSRDVITAEHLAAMRDGAILANAGHFDVEIDVRALAEAGGEDHPGRAPARRRVRCSATAGRLLLLAEGRVVNLVAAEGNPAAGDGRVLRRRRHSRWPGWPPARPRLAAGVHPVPAEIDDADRQADPGVLRGADRHPDRGPAGIPELLAPGRLTQPGG